MNDIIDVIVIGAGQAGLSASRLLQVSGVDHLVLERGEIGETWRSQRWDSFHLNTPNWSNTLAGVEFHPESPDAFCDRDALVTYLEDFVTSFDLPLRKQTPVNFLKKTPNGHYEVQIKGETLQARAVILASGSMSRPKLPEIASKLPSDVMSLSSGTYRNPSSLAGGAVVVVGGGQSACQIAEDLLGGGRETYLCASRVGRFPRTYRGREIVEWWRDMGFLDVHIDDLDDPSIEFSTQPLTSGIKGGHTVSLQALARDGVTLLGRAEDIDGHILKLGSELREYIAYADEKSQMFKKAVDAYIRKAGLSAPEPLPDPYEPELPDLRGSDELKQLDLKKAGVGTVIWGTGFDADWSWVDVGVFDKKGRPNHHSGVTDSPGLYFIGFPWLAKRKSGILYGVTEDADRIVEHIKDNVLTATT